MDPGAANRKGCARVGFDAGIALSQSRVSPAIRPYLLKMVRQRTNKGGTAKLSLSPLRREALFIVWRFKKMELNMWPGGAENLV